MPLTNCPECGRQVSTAAESCPGCGHPLRAADPTGPRCYACNAVATTRCQSCGALSCALHLQSIYVTHGRGGANELRCESCYSSAVTWKIVGGILFVVFLIFIIFIATSR